MRLQALQTVSPLCPGAILNHRIPTMNITLDLPADVEQEMLAEAHARGLSLDELVSELVITRTQRRQRTPSARPSRLWHLRKNLRLGEVSIRELISEGRE